MKAHGMELRARIIRFVKRGGSKLEASRRFEVSRSTVYRYLGLENAGRLEPKKSWGKWRKIDPQKLREHVEAHRSATLKEMAKVFGVNDVGILRALRRLKMTFKKKPQNTASGTKKPERGLWSI
jgi:putative transposase